MRSDIDTVYNSTLKKACCTIQNYRAACLARSVFDAFKFVNISAGPKSEIPDKRHRCLLGKDGGYEDAAIHNILIS